MDFDFAQIFTFLKRLTWSKILQVFVLLSVALLFWIIWIFRTSIYADINMGALMNDTNRVHQLEVSTTVQTHLREIVKNDEKHIAGIQVVDVNFKRNVRNSVYFAVSDSKLKEAVDEFNRYRVAETPLFNDTEANNKRIVDLINNEFICSPFSDTLAYRAYPAAEKSVEVICSISIPPYYGKFVGYLNIYLRQKPDGTEITAIRQLARELAAEIYDQSLRPPTKVLMVR